MRLLFVLTLIAWTQATFAQIQCNVSLSDLSGTKKYPAIVGGELDILLPNTKETKKAVFIGRNLRLDGSTKKFSFFVPSENIIHVLRPSELTIELNGKVIDGDRLQPVVAGINQEDGTCAAYSIFNCMRQLHYDGRTGNGKLEAWLAEEPGRHRLLTPCAPGQAPVA